MNRSLIKQPSAYAPIAMSLAGVGLVLLHVTRYGLTRETDEGTSAHLFQLLMMLEVPIIGYFAVTWLPRVPATALRVLALQAFAMGLAFASVFVFERFAK